MPIIKTFYHIWFTELGRETKNSLFASRSRDLEAKRLFLRILSSRFSIYGICREGRENLNLRFLRKWFWVIQDRRKTAKFRCPGGDKWLWSFLMMIKIRRGMGIVDMAWLWVWYICRYQFCHPSFQSPTLLECNGPRTERRSISLLSSDKRKNGPTNVGAIDKNAFSLLWNCRSVNQGSKSQRPAWRSCR